MEQLRMRWSGTITNSVAMNLSKLPELMADRGPGVVQSMGSQRVRRGLATEPKQPQIGQPTASSIAAAAAKSLQSCLTLCDPIDGSPPDSRVPGILQARTLEWVAISFSNA